MGEIRKLAAILVSDVVGYSRLAGADEDRILARLRALRSDLIDPTIAVHNGRVVKRTGDGSIVEFRSVVDAVRCAIEVQNAMVERNAGAPEDRRIIFRIGIHLGDVVEERDGDLMGDGVNIAARLEGVAKPGAICLSEDAYRQVKSRLDLKVVDLGATQLKNIAEPIHVYSVEPGVPAAQAEATTPAVGMPSNPLTLPDRPSIAVLPFQNMSGDPEQEYFADGVVEDIITALSRFKNLFVIARNSTFTYKGRAVDVKEVARALGVRYVLEGSVRKTPNRVRITGQLIDAATGAHRWADRFEGGLGDIFDLQDQVTASVVAAITPEIERAEIERSKRKPTSNLDAYDQYLLGVASVYRGTKEANDEALRRFNLAIEQDPEFAVAYGWAAFCHLLSEVNGWRVLNDSSLMADAVRLARSAASLGRDDSVALCFAGHTLAYIGREFDDGVALIDLGLALNPNNARGWFSSGWTKAFAGDPKQAIDHFAQAMRLSPRDPLTPSMQNGIATSYLLMGRYDEASSWAGKAIREWPNYVAGLLIYTVSNALAGRLAEAKEAAGRLNDRNVGWSLSNLKNSMTLRRREDWAKFMEGARLAGLAE